MQSAERFCVLEDMMLDQFYKVREISRNETGGDAWVELNPAHAVYAGHFPGMPVVPGVCSLMMIKACAEQMTGKKCIYHHLYTCKFLAVIQPDRVRNVRISLKWQENQPGEYLLHAQAYIAGNVVLKLKAMLLAR